MNLISYLSQIEISIKHEIILYLVCEALKKTPTGAELTGNHNRVGEQKTVVICREIQKELIFNTPPSTDSFVLTSISAYAWLSALNSKQNANAML